MNTIEILLDLAETMEKQRVAERKETKKVLMQLFLNQCATVKEESHIDNILTKTGIERAVDHGFAMFSC